MASGATALTGSKKHAAGAQFYTPTVLANVTRDMRVNTEEIFGPVAPLIRFKTEDEAVSIANDTPFGLAAYFFTKGVNRAWRVAQRIKTGMFFMNDGIFSNEVIGNIAEILQCYPRCAFGWAVVRLNPETLQIEAIVRADAAQSLYSATGAAAVDDEVWVASVFSDRIAIVDLPLTGARHD